MRARTIRPTANQSRACERGKIEFRYFFLQNIFFFATCVLNSSTLIKFIESDIEVVIATGNTECNKNFRKQLALRKCKYRRKSFINYAIDSFFLLPSSYLTYWLYSETNFFCQGNQQSEMYFLLTYIFCIIDQSESYES